MATPTINDAFIDKFNSDVKLAYQQRQSKLRMCVRTDADVQAQKVRFQKLGAISARTKARNGEIPPSNPEHTHVDCTPADKYTLDYVDALDLTKLNIEVRGNYVATHAAAFARETDDVIIAAMAAGATTNFNGYTGHLTRAKVLQWAEYLDRADIDRDMQWYAAITPRGFAHLMSITEFANSQYVGPDLPYVSHKEIRTWYGIHWIVHNRLPGIGTSQAKMYLWHKTSTGQAVNSDVDITWAWENTRKAWSAAGSMSMGAVVIDANGIIECRVDDTTALP